MSAVVKVASIETAAAPRPSVVLCIAFILCCAAFCLGDSVGEKYGRTVGRADEIAALKRVRFIPGDDWISCGYTVKEIR